MELGKAFIFREVSVPESYGLIDVEFPGKVTAYPPVRKVHKVDIKFLQVLEYLRVCLLHKCFHFVNYFVNSWLQLSVVVLNVINNFRQAPKYISFCTKKIIFKL